MRAVNGRTTPSWAAAVRGAAVAMLAVLGSLATAIALRITVSADAQVPILAVVLALTLSRVAPRSTHERTAAVMEMPLVALAAGAVGWLVIHEPWLGQPMLVLGLSVGIWMRRWGPAVRRAGRFVSLPFVGLLITPVPVDIGGASAILWAPVAALVALGWTTVAALVARPSPGAAPDVPASPATGSQRSGHHRLDAPTRMAVQMATGLGGAFVAGHLLFGDRWAWTVLSAYLVASGNRGRGDVVHKAGLRVLGAAVGTVGATLVVGALPAGHRRLLVALFVIMFAALVLRQRSYAWWAVGVTAMVAVLHAYYGYQGEGSSELTERLLGVLVGSAIGLSAAYLVLPVRTVDVFRRRIADCLAALTDDLDPTAQPADAAVTAAFPAAVHRLDELVPTLRAHARIDRRDPTVVRLRAVWALEELLALPVGSQERGRLRRDVVRVRRSMVGRDDPRPEELVPAMAAVHRALH
jgi:Fusaric acid resistance protein-like